MKLYTAISTDAYQVLCALGQLRAPLRVTLAHTEPDPFRRAYDWLAEQMVQRGLIRPDPGFYPLWAWPDYDKLCSSYLRPDGPVTVLSDQVYLEIDVPDSLVLLSDYELWHLVLNGSRATEKEKALWPRLMFDLKWRDPYYRTKDFTVQATFWTLGIECVSRVIPLSEILAHAKS